MNDLISRQEAIDAIKTSRFLVDALEKISKLPSAERKGHWILQEDRTKKLYGWHICSECGAWIGEPSKFCSECGARMDGEQ